MDLFSIHPRPVFVVVDGQDGSGKDTQAINIVKYFFDKGINKIYLRSHPALDNVYGRKTKEALERGGKKGHLIAALFYTIDVIRSIIFYYRKDSRVVIFSRYLLGVCYLPNSLIFVGYNFFERILPTSKFFFYLDVSPNEAMSRISKRGGKEEMFENLPRLRKMYRKMDRITTEKEWVRINGDVKPNEVWEQIKRVLDRSFN